MEKEKIYILGVGHNTVVYMDLVEACGYEIAGLYHYNNDKVGELYYGVKIIGSFDDLFSKKNLANMKFALSMGDNFIRKELFYKIKAANGMIPTLIHPSAIVSRHSILGEGVVVHINSVIHPDVTIGDNTVFSYNTSITHSSKIGSHSYVALSAMIGAHIVIGDNVFIGIKAGIVSSKVDYIGDFAYIGAGALVVKSVEARTMVIGSPAKVYKRLNDNMKWELV